jgi:hypothetical protein
MKTVDELKLEISLLEGRLEYARKHTYIGETFSLHAADGELIIGYGNDQWLTIAIDQLFQDLPSIINLVCLEQIRMQDGTLQRIKDELNEL